jgi:hypothetical protein
MYPVLIEAKMSMLEALMRGRNGGVGVMGDAEAVEIVTDDGTSADITRRPCMLKEDEDELNKEMDENDEHGINDPDYECELCRVGNMAMSDGKDFVKKASPALQEVYDIYPVMSPFYPEEVVYDTMAKKWNNTVHEMDGRLSYRWRTRRLHKAHVRHHMKKHYPKNDYSKIQQHINFVDRSMTKLRYGGFWEREYKGSYPNLDKEEEINGSKHNEWGRLCKQYIELHKLAITLKQQEEKSKGAAKSVTNVNIHNTQM